MFDLNNGRRLYHVRGFRGAYFDGEKCVYADFPKFEKTERTTARLELARQDIEPGRPIEEPFARQLGRYLVLRQPKKKDANPSRDMTLIVQDVATGKELWSRKFPKEAPDVYMSPQGKNMLLVWRLGTDAARQEIKDNDRLKQQLAAMKDSGKSYFLEVVDPESGKPSGRLLVDSGKGTIQVVNVVADGDWLALTDTLNQTLVYSLSTGQQKGALFGSPAALSSAAGLLCVANETGEISVYDLAGLAKLTELRFSYPVSIMEFGSNGKRLFVLTDNQVAYLFDAAALASSAATSTSAR